MKFNPFTSRYRQPRIVVTRILCCILLASGSACAKKSPKEARGDSRLIFEADGYNREGYNREGYNREGCNREGYNREGCNREGYNREGYNRDGYNRAGY